MDSIGDAPFKGCSLIELFMKKLLIIYPHYPPSNLAGVHRPRLLSLHLKEFGWEPIILTVDEKYYEEEPDWNLVKLLPAGQRIIKVRARERKFGIGDIGLRAFDNLYNKAVEIIQGEKIDFVYIPIPSFYAALLGPKIKGATGVPYGIDYIDPWVHIFPGSEKRFSKAWASTQLARRLEPRAVKNASLITGVAEGYYKGVLERNPQLKEIAVTGAMPYGGEKADHDKVMELKIPSYLFKKNGKFQLVYAGAMLPKAYGLLENIMKAISGNLEIFKDVEFHFIGSGSIPTDDQSFNIKPMAEKYGLWGSVFIEYPKRIPYLDVIAHLNTADGVFILGSTEPHYTPSKSYQAVLSEKPVLAVLHTQSTAVKVIRDSGAGVVLDFDGEKDINCVYEEFPEVFNSFRSFCKKYDAKNINMKEFDKYSAREVSKFLAELLDQAIEKKRGD